MSLKTYLKRIQYYLSPDKNLAKKAEIAKLRHFPDAMWIEPTNFCNYKCSFCPHSEGLKREKGFMDLSLYKKIIDDIAPFMRNKKIALHFIGESLLHKQLHEMVKIASDKGIKVLFFTNASLLTLKIFKRLSENGLHRLTISLDGTNKEEYENRQVGGQWENVIKNIREVIRYKNSSDCETIITINHLVYDEKEFESSIKKLRKIIGVNDVKIQGHILHTWGGNIKLNKERPSHKKTEKGCPFIFSAMVITWDGKVLPCTQDPHGTLVMGDATKDGVLEIWNSEKFVELRRIHLKRDKSLLPDTCKNCEYFYGYFESLQMDS
jgi:radical SAM protein with 4Fe4S-binding SPASM domain